MTPPSPPSPWRSPHNAGETEYHVVNAEGHMVESQVFFYGHFGQAIEGKGNLRERFLHRQGFFAVAPAFGIKASAETLDTILLQQTYRELVANYDGKLDTNSLIQGASKGMVVAAGDKYTTFLDAQEAEQFNSDMSGSIGGGVGAQIGLRDNQVT